MTPRAVLHPLTPAPSRTGGSVYPRREDTALLLPFATAAPGRWVADVGTGNGALALAAAHAGARVVATDLNAAALRALAAVARREGLPVVALRTDLLVGTRRFDRILCNPPYLPTPVGAADLDPWDDLALNGGPDGLRVAARLAEELPDRLAPGGRAFLLGSTLQPAPARRALRARLRRRGILVREVASRRLEGERLFVWELRRGRPAARRTARRPTGTRARRRTRPPRPGASNPAPARGRSRARGGASVRRRSPPGS